MYFYPKGENAKPIEYEGNRTFEDFKAFLFKHSEVLKNRKDFVKEEL
jgi:hypothetical protein